MLEELKKINIPAETEGDTGDKTNINDKKKHKKRVRNIIKAIQENPDYGKGTLNPICRLIQIQQANKGKEPVFKLVEERRKFRRHEFIIQVNVGDLKCHGSGSNKRIAKQNASQAMLIQLGYQQSQIQQQQQQQQQLPKPVLKTQTNKINSNTEKKVKFVDETDIKNDDGLLQQSKSSNINNNNVKETNRNLFNKKYKEKSQKFNQTLYSACLIANDLITKGHSETADYLGKNKNKKLDNTSKNEDDKKQNIILSNTASYKDKLNYIADLLDFEVKFQSLTKVSFLLFLFNVGKILLLFLFIN
jgi:hypothetical protein